ncbi:hypothetical protein SAMN04515674_11691 [Pseudarcicella hirudinis]|uniref:Uncharacterized protein n=1 Tax=Pseudarcicella hirudinis TaxID=1079859 RepID=A0A1I5Y0S2_9BACT|nr:hypothetical protein SAMN04515674_11691 [Pseudarcicella hirudinis]
MCFDILGVRLPFSVVRTNKSVFMERKSRIKIERSQKDLDQRITDFHAQNEEERLL